MNQIYLELHVSPENADYRKLSLSVCSESNDYLFVSLFVFVLFDFFFLSTGSSQIAPPRARTHIHFFVHSYDSGLQTTKIDTDTHGKKIRGL